MAESFVIIEFFYIYIYIDRIAIVINEAAIVIIRAADLPWPQYESLLYMEGQVSIIISRQRLWL